MDIYFRIIQSLKTKKTFNQIFQKKFVKLKDLYYCHFIWSVDVYNMNILKQNTM